MTNPRPSYRALWLPDLLWLTLLLFLSIVPFLDGSLDLRLQSLFHAKTGAAWPYEFYPLWRFLYRFGTWPALVVSVAALAAFILGSRRPTLARWRRHCLYLFLVLAISPGLFVNTIFKDHWGRPRPRQVTEFGGHWEFQPVLEQGAPGRGKSFPCGHSSTGYYFVAFYFLLRRRRKLIATLVLTASAFYGTLIGLARMAAGAHFASDVLWSAFFPALAAFLLYYVVLRLPYHEDHPSTPKPLRHPVLVGICASLLATAGLLAWLAGTPAFKEWHETILIPPGRTPCLALAMEQGDVELVLTDTPGRTVTLTGEMQGFGWPWSKISSNLSLSKQDPGLLRVEVTTCGGFTELSGGIQIQAPARLFSEITATLRNNTMSLTIPEGLQTPPMSFDLTRSTLTLPPALRSRLMTVTESNDVRHLQLPSP